MMRSLSSAFCNEDENLAMTPTTVDLASTSSSLLSSNQQQPGGGSQQIPQPRRLSSSCFDFFPVGGSGGSVFEEVSLVPYLADDLYLLHHDNNIANANSFSDNSTHDFVAIARGETLMRRRMSSQDFNNSSFHLAFISPSFLSSTTNSISQQRPLMICPDPREDAVEDPTTIISDSTTFNDGPAPVSRQGKISPQKNLSSSPCSSPSSPSSSSSDEDEGEGDGDDEQDCSEDGSDPDYNIRKLPATGRRSSEKKNSSIDKSTNKKTHASSSSNRRLPYPVIPLRCQTKQPIPTAWPDEVLDLPLPNFKAYLSGLSGVQAADLKAARRRKKNRLYARHSRHRRLHGTEFVAAAAEQEEEQEEKVVESHCRTL